MTSPQPAPKVSVIIPACNQAVFLPEAIHSVQAQTFTDWELLVVDDGSTDDTPQVLAPYAGDNSPDPRVRGVRQENRGLPGARNTGIRHACGPYLAFLDADDSFRPEKLAAQVAHLDSHPDVGLSYASRIEVDGEGRPVWMLRAPSRAPIEDLALGFPFTINDILLRRQWIDLAGTFDESFRLHSEDRDFYMRLALEGCRFDRCDRFLAFRRLHTHRRFDRIPERIAVMRRALDTAFDDPRCPASVLTLRDTAFARVYLSWAWQELFQGEAASGQKHLRQALRLDPSLNAPAAPGEASGALLKSLVWFSIRDGGDHAALLERIFAGLPEELSGLRMQLPWAAGRGYLIRAARDVIWERMDSGRLLFGQAAGLRARLDDQLLRMFLDQLAAIASEYGPDRAGQALERLLPLLKEAGSPAQLRWLDSAYWMGQAYQDYRRGRSGRVPASILRAVRRSPARLADRGLLSILARSLLGSLARPSMENKS